VIDGNNNTILAQISAGKNPHHILLEHGNNTHLYRIDKIYVTNYDSSTVSVINATSYKKEASDIPVETGPTSIASDGHKIYVTSYNKNTVSVINASNNKREPDIPVETGPTSIAVSNGNIYVTNSGNGTISVINASNNKREPDIPVETGPTSIAVSNDFPAKIYVTNSLSNTVSVINPSNHTKITAIHVGFGPDDIAYNFDTHMIYVVNSQSHSVSVIDGSSDKVAAGVTLKTYPVNSGTLICGNKEYPTNTYIFIDNGTSCTPQAKNNFKFDGWVQNLNPNSSLPLYEPSGSLIINRYGTFTANFKPLPPPIPPEYLAPLYGIIATSIIGWSWTSIIGWLIARTQRKHLKECINQIGKLNKKAIEEKIIRYYIDGKISEDHRQLLKDKISLYYDSDKNSDEFGTPL
jgi:YVTN family beta-propeller protein